MRFRLDKDGNILPPFTFEKKKFVTPMQELGNYQGTGVEAYENQNTPDTPIGDPSR